MQHEDLSKLDPADVREDQVEALLKLVGGALEVIHHERTNDYEAVIRVPDPDAEEVGVFGVDIAKVRFHGDGQTRIEAVREAWRQCLEFAQQNGTLKWALKFL